MNCHPAQKRFANYLAPLTSLARQSSSPTINPFIVILLISATMAIRRRSLTGPLHRISPRSLHFTKAISAPPVSPYMRFYGAEGSQRILVAHKYHCWGITSDLTVAIQRSKAGIPFVWNGEVIMPSTATTTLLGKTEHWVALANP